MLYFVENLTWHTWAFSIWPRLLRLRLRTGRTASVCYVIDGSPLALLVARASSWVAGVSVRRLAFRLVDVRDKEGLSIRLRVAYQDLAAAQRYAIAEPIFQQLLQSEPPANRLPIFLAKNLAIGGQSEGDTMWRSLLKVQVCVWKAKEEAGEGWSAVLFLERRPWFKAIANYAAQEGLTIIPVAPTLRFKSFLRRRLPPAVIDLLRVLRYRPRRLSLASLFQGRAVSEPSAHAGNELKLSVDGTGHSVQDSRSRVAVEYYGQLNLNRPELHSDLFFWQSSALEGRDLLVTFAFPQYPLNEAEWSELREHGIGAVALHASVTSIPGVPVFTRRAVLPRKQRGGPVGGGLEAAWLGKQAATYHALRSYWTEVFKACRVKVYVTWHKYDAIHCVMADALQALGGVTTIYQRAYESHPSAETTIGADIVFGFSPEVAEVERLSNSVIRYHVTTGYVGDHHFPLLRAGAQRVRHGLEQHGAQRILAYFDENSLDDDRWHTGHSFMRDNYSFLLEKVLAEPWLGLALKPKTPRTLRRRLGPVVELLDRALATGRCHIYEGGTNQGSYPPAAAALAADVAVHGHLCAATAGMEAALAGVRTLLLDREGWPVSPLYRLGVGRVVFRDWQGLWEACLDHWRSPEGVPQLGDWSPMLSELDPFCDGRAAERMGTYIRWLMEGFKAGLNRETVMADAAERYCTRWGSDKVTQVKAASQILAPASADGPQPHPIASA